MNGDDALNKQLNQVARELRKVADTIEKKENKETDPEVEGDITTVVEETLFTEAGTILQSAIDQLSGNRPEKMDPDQLYGWSDALQRTLGNKASAPNSEIRKLEDLVAELTKALGK